MYEDFWRQVIVWRYFESSHTRLIFVSLLRKKAVGLSTNYQGSEIETLTRMSFNCHLIYWWSTCSHATPPVTASLLETQATRSTWWSRGVSEARWIVGDAPSPSISSLVFNLYTHSSSSNCARLTVKVDSITYAMINVNTPLGEVFHSE